VQGNDSLRLQTYSDLLGRETPSWQGDDDGSMFKTTLGIFSVVRGKLSTASLS
jgi:hypothetical protein